MKKNKQFIFILILFLLSVIVVYFEPTYKSSFLIFTLLLFFNSKPKWDYFWVFFVLLLVDNPGNLFWEETNNIIKIGPIILSFLQCFILTAVLKIIIKKKLYNDVKIFFAKDSIPYFIWLVFLLIEGLILGVEGGGRTGYRYYYNYGLTFVIFPVFFILPYMIKNKSDLLNFFSLAAIFVILNFLTQVYNLIIGQSLHTLLGGTIPIGYDDSTILERHVKLLRPVYFVYSSFFAFILAPFFIYIKEKALNRFYLYLVFVISLFSVFLTATRGWIIAFLIYILILSFIDIFVTKKFTTPKIAFSLLIVLIISINTIPAIEMQFFSSLQRLETISFLLKGDQTLGGTDRRLTSRIYPVLVKFEERPITGWGFSKIGMETFDGHTGNASILMIGGLTGGIIILIFLYKLFMKQYKLYKALHVFNKYKKGVLIISASLIILLIIHSSSSQVFGFYRYVSDGGHAAYWLAIYFVILSIVYNTSVNEQKQLNK